MMRNLVKDDIIDVIKWNGRFMKVWMLFFRVCVGIMLNGFFIFDFLVRICNKCFEKFI